MYELKDLARKDDGLEITDVMVDSFSGSAVVSAGSVAQLHRGISIISYSCADLRNYTTCDL